MKAYVSVECSNCNNSINEHESAYCSECLEKKDNELHDQDEKILDLEERIACLEDEILKLKGEI